MKNIKPVDELGDVRAEIRWLQAREKVLRQTVLDDPLLWSGSRYEASVANTVRQTANIEKLRQMYPEVATEVIVVTPMTRLTIHGVDEE